MSFQKQEGNIVFYNDIPEQDITITVPERSFGIDFNEVDVKSLGRPIELEI